MTQTPDSAGLFERASAFFQQLQSEICDGLESLDGGAAFNRDAWQREGGGGGLTRVLSGGALFEKAGVNWSGVEGELEGDLAASLPGEGRGFRASGVSLVLHPRSPMVPTAHANYRCLQHGSALWFGGGADLTPYYLFAEDAVHFHRTLRKACEGHAEVADYARFKRDCDEYFYLPHRREARGVGGIFFDYLRGDADRLEAIFAFVQAAGRAFLEAYVPIAARRRDCEYGERQIQWQQLRRGRYVEFNLIYDRGTVFGLKTGGRIESILMSLPPQVRWEYCPKVESGSPEAALLEGLVPRDWAAGAG